MTAQTQTVTVQQTGRGPVAGGNDPTRFVIAALRLFACPCSAPLHETLREGSPAAHLLTVMRVIDRHARRPLRLHPADHFGLSSDETAFAALIACTQQKREAELKLRCRTLVRPAGQKALAEAVAVFARQLEQDGVALPAPAASGPPQGSSQHPPVLTQVKRTVRTSAG